MRIGSRRPTRYVLVPGPVIMPGLSPRTRPTSWDTVAVFGNAGSIQLTPASLSHAEVTVLDVRACTELGRGAAPHDLALLEDVVDRKSTRLNSSHDQISYAVFCLKKKTE